MPSPWQTPQEAAQPYTSVICFTYTSNGDTASNIVTLSGRMSLGQSISLIVYDNDCYINLDNTAARPTGSPLSTRDGVLVKAGTGYSVSEKAGLTTRISAITAVNTSNFQITGVIWGY